MIKHNLFALACLLTITVHAQQSESTEPQQLPDYPRVAVKTNAGDFMLELFTSRAPLTVRNFVDYVESGFYSNTVFHRVVGNFVVQGGGYDVNYQPKATRDKVPNESGNGLTNRRGFVAMARTGEPHSADSQFYINLTDNAGLDPIPTRWGYTVFGRVIEGMDVIDDIGYRATGPGLSPALGKDVPLEAIVVLGMEMLPQTDLLPAATNQN